MILLAMLAIPTIVALGFLIFGGKRVTIKEFLAQMGVQVVLMSLVCWAVSYTNMGDREIINGRVQSKAKERVSCEHSYSCNCHESCSGSGKDRSCYEICQTCYEHSYDVDWAVYLNIGKRLTIDRVNRQGTIEPSRWDRVVIGEPASVSHHYDNYVKASPDTLFRHQGLEEKYTKLLPEYPGKIYDYYRIDRFISEFSLYDKDKWINDIREMNADLGPSKQANVALLIVKNRDQEYFDALQQVWVGGKKNDIVVVVDVNDTGEIQWVNTMAWTNDQMLQVTIRDSILAAKTLNRSAILSSINTNVIQHYIRKPMKDFEYLKDLMKPTVGQWIFAMIFGLIISIGMGLFAYYNDVFDDEDDGLHFRWRRR